jgi:peroxiredoxin Q/BCP
MALVIGEYAPEFTLFNEKGESIDLRDFRGQWVVLYFYPRDNTPGCTKEACGFRDQYQTYEANQVVILGVSADNAQSHQKFINKQNLPFILLCDLDTTVAKTYEAFGLKKFMGKEYEGIYRHTFLIDPEGKIAKIYRKVKPADHAMDVLKDLELLRQKVT